MEKSATYNYQVKKIVKPRRVLHLSRRHERKTERTAREWWLFFLWPQQGWQHTSPTLYDDLTQAVIIHSLLMFVLIAVPFQQILWLPISLYLSFYEILHVHNLKGPGGIVYLGIFFCKVTLSMANCKACPVNNLPLGNRCLKSILHDSLASFYHSKSLLSRKIFPTHCQKALNKGK